MTAELVRQYHQDRFADAIILCFDVFAGGMQLTLQKPQPQCFALGVSKGKQRRLRWM